MAGSRDSLLSGQFTLGDVLLFPGASNRHNCSIIDTLASRRELEPPNPVLGGDRVAEVLTFWDRVMLIPSESCSPPLGVTLENEKAAHGDLRGFYGGGQGGLKEWCPSWGSNPHWIEFESTASTWLG